MGIEVGLRKKIVELVPPCGVFEDHSRDTALKKYVIFGRDSREQEVMYDGPGLIDDSFGIECRAEKVEDAREIADAVRQLNGFAGLFPDGTRVLLAEVQDQDSDYVSRTGDANDGLYSINLKLVISHAG